MSGKSRFCKTVVVTACCLTLATGFCGCRETDALKHINHTQNASTVDTKTEKRYLISNPSAQKTSESVPAVEVDRSARATSEKQNIVVFSSKPNAPRYLAKKSVFSLDPDFKGLEASDGVKLVKAKKNEPALDREEVQDPEPPKNNEDKSDGAVTSQDKKTGKSESDKGNDGKTDNGKGDSSNSGKDASKNGSDTQSDQSKGGNSDGKDEVATTDTTSKYTEPPKVARVAAFGQTAVIVQMVGGEGALVAADKELLDGKFSTVFADEGAKKIATGWKADGSIDANAIVSAGAQTILVDSSSYQKSLSEKDRAILKKAGITFTILPKLSNSSYIKEAVSKVGAMLAEAKGIGNEGKTEQVASDYQAFHDRVITDCINANGGNLAGTKTYEIKNKRRYSYKSDAQYTLLIDKYDESAVFKGTFAGKWTPTCNGIGICTYGYGGTPTSFYLQAGGLINNAAARGSSTNTSSIVAWQFSNNSMSFKKSAWSFSSSGAMADCDNIVGSAWDQVLFTTDVNEDGNGVGSSFGSSTFPTVIAGTQKIKKLIIANSKDKNGAYHPYEKEAAAGGSAFGKKVDNSICYSSIGVDGKSQGENVFANGQIEDGSVLVNPAGLFSSWTTGSVESFLEAAWSNDVAQGNSNTVGVKDAISSFYQKFYRYDVSNAELNDILDGD